MLHGKRMRRTLNGHTKKRIASSQEWRCAMCSSLLDESYEVDHTVPLHLGGEDKEENCRALCCSCHRRITVAQEADRVERRRKLRLARVSCPPVVCLRCDRVLSPYFLHRCDR